MIKYLLYFGLLLITFSIANAQEVTLLQAGYDKLNSRNFEGAIQDFNQLIATQPNNIDALCGRAEAKIDLGNYSEASNDADQALNIDGDNSKALTFKAEALFNLKDYSNALKLYDMALQKQNPPAMATVGRAKVMNQLGNSKDAYKIIDDAIERQPSNPEFYYARGIFNSTKEKYSKALQDFEKTVKINPQYNTFGILLNCGIAYLNNDEPDKAIECLNKAIDMDPKSAAAYHTRGLSHYAQEEYKESVEDFLKSMDLSPNNQNTLFNLGMAYYKLNDKENACLYFHKSCQSGNTNSCKMVIMVCSDTNR